MYLEGPLGVTLLSAQQNLLKKPQAIQSHKSHTHKHTRRRVLVAAAAERARRRHRNAKTSPHPFKTTAPTSVWRSRAATPSGAAAAFSHHNKHNHPLQPQPTVSNPNRNDVTSAKGLVTVEQNHSLFSRPPRLKPVPPELLPAAFTFLVPGLLAGRLLGLPAAARPPSLMAGS